MSILVIRVEVPDRIDPDEWGALIVADELIDDADYVVVDAEWARPHRSEVADHE